MDGPALDRRLRRWLRDTRTTLSASREPQFRRLSSTYRLPEGARRVFCFHIRKTAGTSLHFSFLGLGGEDPAVVQQRLEDSPLHRTISGDYSFVAHQRRLVEQGHYFYGWSNAPAHRISLRPGTFTLTVLRDPVNRIISHYGYLREGDEPGMAFAVPSAERALSEKGFQSFLDELPRQHLLRQLFMFSRGFSVAEAVETILSCSSVMFTEEFEVGLTALAKRLELPLEARRERATRARPSISDAERERLREMLEPEYEMIRQLRMQVKPLHSH